MASSYNFPNRPFRLEQRNSIYAQNAWHSGNNSLVHVELWIIKNSYSPTFNSSASDFSISVSGTPVGGGNFTYDFRNSDSLLLHASDNWFSADSEGYMYYTVNAACNAQTLGSTSTNEGVWAPRIPQLPLSPISYTPDQEITATSMLYQFGGRDLRGGGLLRWEFQWSTSSTFASGNSAIFTSSGTSTVSDLPPGTSIYFRSRAVTNIGSSEWSNIVTAQTLASVRVSNGSSWLAPQVLVSTGTAWVSPGALISKSGAWVNPLP